MAMKDTREPKQTRSVRLSLDRWQKLEAIQKRTGATPGEQIRRGVDLWLKQQEAGK